MRNRNLLILLLLLIIARVLIAYPENKVPMEVDTTDNHVVNSEKKEDIFESTEGLKEVPSEDDFKEEEEKNEEEEKEDESQEEVETLEKEEIKEVKTEVEKKEVERKKTEEKKAPRKETDTKKEEKKVPQEVKEKTVVETSKKSEPSYSANHIYFLGKKVPYKNGGTANCQSIIDNDIHLASTFGGAETYSGDDGLNTHFAAHRHGAFKGLWNLKAGDKVTVTDGNSKPTHYIIKNMVLLDENGISQDGTSYYDEVMGTHGGERITLQTCSPRVENYNCMYFADKL